MLVGAEIAIALFLLIGSCLLIRGVYLLDHQELGFNHDHLLTAGVTLDKARYAEAAKQNQFVRSLVTQLEQLPGVKDAALASSLSGLGPWQRFYSHQGSTTIAVERAAHSRRCSGHAGLFPGRRRFRAERSRLQCWRRCDYARVVLVNQEFAHKYFQDHDPVGKQIQLEIADAPSAWSEIVGVVGNVKSYSEDPGMEPQVYELYVQRPVASFSVMLRSTADPASLTPALRHVVAGLDSELPLLRVMSMDNVIEAQRGGNPLFTQLLGTFAILALILSAIGIYGLIAYSVGQRTHEIGIRLALGAKQSDISRMILRQGFKVAAAGLAIGFTMALPLPKLFNSIFQGLIPFGEPVIYPIVLAVMLMVVFCATLGPARRATRVDAIRALRNE